MTPNLVTCLKCGATSDPRYWFCPTDGELMVIGRLVGGEWKLERRLGAGAMGAVYLARHDLDDRLAAVKILGPRVVADPGADDVLRFLRESAARVRHHNCVEIQDVGRVLDAQGQDLALFWIRMDYVDGVPLDRTQRPVPWPRLSRLAEDMCSGLAACHREGIVHRDIKPANMLVETATQTLKVSDFGIARLTGAPTLTSTGAVPGTLLYMAPELFEGGRGDAASDLWALGVVLYELMTGRHPFVAANDGLWTLVTRVQNAAPAPLGAAGYPPGLESIVLRLLEKNPKDRFASADAVGDKLLALTPVAVRVVNEALLLDVNLSVSRESTLAQVRQRALEASSLSVAAVNVLRSPQTRFSWTVGDRPATDNETLSSACPVGSKDPVVLHLRVHADTLLGA